MNATTLFAEYPRPWTVDVAARGAYSIMSANGVAVMLVESHMGDGDSIHLTTEQAQELCALVNGIEWAKERV